MKKLRRWVIRVLGLRGSWRWACRQMQAGLYVYDIYEMERFPNNEFAVFYLNYDGDRFIWEWITKKTTNPKPNDDGSEPAELYLSYFEQTNWAVWEWPIRQCPTCNGTGKAIERQS